MDIYGHQGANVKKSWALMVTFLVVVIMIGWLFSFIYQSPGILYFAIFFSIAMNFFSYWYSDKIILKMTGAISISRESHRDLWNIVENLSITAGLPMPKVYIIKESAPNAFATGRNKDNAAVAFTTGLLQILDKNELEGVVAHELAHIGNRDILLSTIIVVLVGFVTLLSDFFLRMSIFGHGRNGGDNKAGLWMAILGIVLAIMAPFIALIIQLAISRKREFLADASGALLTRYPEGLASALEKISNSSHRMRMANHATAHLFIANPFKEKSSKKKDSFITKLFMTHPPVEDRVKALRGRV